jgi:hypothetical protein
MAVFPVLRVKQPSVRGRDPGPRQSCDLPWGAGNEHGASCNFPLLNHLQHHSGGFTRLLLAHKALRRNPRLERVGIDAESTNMRMRGDQVEASELLALRDCDDRLEKISR